MNTSTIWYAIYDAEHLWCDSPMVFCYAPRQAAQKIAEDFANELAFVTRLDPEKIKVWVD